MPDDTELRLPFELTLPRPPSPRIHTGRRPPAAKLPANGWPVTTRTTPPRHNGHGQPHPAKGTAHRTENTRGGRKRSLIPAAEKTQPETATTPLTPGQAAAVLADLPIAETLAATLATQAAHLADAVRANLATPPGGPHDHPWRQTGALQASIEHQADGLTAQIGTSHPAAAAQELGTATIPPRPYLAPAADALAEPIAQQVGQAIATLLRQRLGQT